MREIVIGAAAVFALLFPLLSETAKATNEKFLGVNVSLKLDLKIIYPVILY